MDKSTGEVSGGRSTLRQRPRPRQRTGLPTGGRQAGADTRSADRGEMPVSTQALTRPSPRVPEPNAPLPHDVFEVIVTALADALVLDYQHDRDAMVDSPRRKGRDAEPRGA